MVWEAPKLIIQIDSLMHLWSGNEGSFKKAYDMIILDESESLLAHIDEKTMEKKEIGIFNFFNALLKQCGKILFMDGDMSQRSLTFPRRPNLHQEQERRRAKSYEPNPRRGAMEGTTPGGLNHIFQSGSKIQGLCCEPKFNES